MIPFIRRIPHIAAKKMSRVTENKFEAPNQGPFNILQIYDNAQSARR